VISSPQWPLRPRIKPGESLAGYVYRLFSDNGHMLSPPAKQLLHACYTNRDPDIDIEELVATHGLVGLGDDMDLLAWNLAWRSFWQLQALHRTPFQYRVGIRLCLCCLKEKRIHLRFWELPLVTACPAHRCELLTRCMRCGRSLRWADMRPDWEHCCGKPILEAESVPASKFSQGVSSWIAQAADAPRHCPNSPSRPSIGESSSTLHMRYRRLMELNDARRLIIEELVLNGARDAFIWRQPPTTRREPHLWELKMASGGPQILRSELLKLILRFFRTGNRTQFDQRVLVSLDDYSPVARMLDRIVSTDNVLRQPVLDLIAAYQLQVPISRRVFFHPAVTAHLRARFVQRLRLWWLAVCMRVRGIRLHDDRNEVQTWMTASDERELVVLEILNTAIRIAQQHNDIDTCAAVFEPLVSERTWAPADSGSNLLVRMAVQLLVLMDDAVARLAAESQAMLAKLEEGSS
jgi:hypothetical protein